MEQDLPWFGNVRARQTGYPHDETTLILRPKTRRIMLDASFLFAPTEYFLLRGRSLLTLIVSSYTDGQDIFVRYFNL